MVGGVRTRMEILSQLFDLFFLYIYANMFCYLAHVKIQHSCKKKKRDNKLILFKGDWGVLLAFTIIS